MKDEFVGVELFQMERRRERKERFLMLVGICLLTIVSMTFADFGDALNAARNSALPLVKAAANLVLFFMFLSKVIPALTGGQKDNNWWEIIGIIAAAIVVNTSVDIWNLVVPSEAQINAPSPSGGK